MSFESSSYDFSHLKDDEREAVIGALELSMDVISFLMAQVGSRTGLIKCALRCALMMAEDACNGKAPDAKAVVDFILMEYAQDKVNPQND